MLVFAWACELVLLDWELTWTRWLVKACAWIRRRLQQVSAYYRSVAAHVVADEFLRLEVQWHFYVCQVAPRSAIGEGSCRTARINAEMIVAGRQCSTNACAI